jgi:formylglycine-generating enzyme required for sulfatase activity
MPEGGADRPRRTARVATKMSWQLGAALAIGGIALVGALLTLINSHAGNAAIMQANVTASTTSEEAGQDALQASAGAQASSSQIQVSPASTATSVEAQLNDADGARIVFVPEGDFMMGITASQALHLVDLCSSCTPAKFEDSIPQHMVGLGAFWIYQTEVTNQMYQKCVEKGRCLQPLEYDSETRRDYYADPAHGNYPVVHLDWYRADDYCRWAGGRLPTEAEWEKAARGTDGRLFPWGDQAPNAQLANVDPFVGDTVRVGSYPRGASPYGALDMAGNVWEWVADWYTATAYDDAVGLGGSLRKRGVSRLVGA